MNRKIFFELSGEHPLMPSAEARACIAAEADGSFIISQGPGHIIASFDDSSVGAIADRIALTHHIGTYLGAFGRDGNIDGIAIPEGTFAIRARRFEGMMRGADSQDLVKKLGTVLSRTNDVDLKDPDMEIRIHMSDRAHVFISEHDIDRDILETRKVGERPFFSPISLHPRYARAAINLTGVKRGGVVLDPFCGTGGIAIEAAFMGMKAVVSDFDGAMIDGCIENMEHYGLRLHDHAVMDIGDIAERFGDVDAVVTDPPYGRSTCTGGEEIESIYSRAMVSIPKVLKSGGKACVVLPQEIRGEGLALDDVFVQKVHGSLSRHYHVFSRP